VNANASRTPSRAELIFDHLALWLAAAVLAGFLHLAVARAIRLGFSVVRWGWESRDLIWRVPIGYGLVFLPVAVFLLLLVIVLRWRLPSRVPVWLWSTLVLFSLLLLFPQINGYASLLLAGGVSLRLAPLMLRQPDRFARIVRTIGIAGAATVLLLAASLPKLRASRERAAMVGLPTAPQGAANVLLLILDTVRADYLSLYGAPEQTSPRLSEWSQRGTVFEQSYATSSWTTPSHASLFTGHYPSAHGASFTRRLDKRHTTLAEVLAGHGWATAGFTANFAATPIESGLAQGFIHYSDLKNSLTEIAKSTTITQADNVVRFVEALRNGRGLGAALARFTSSDFEPRFTHLAHDAKSAEEVAAEFSVWLDQRPEGRPFFAFLNVLDAHYPYAAPEPYASMFTDEGSANQYRGAIRYVDEQVNLILRDLDRRGILQNTVVVITSDHGEHFGEHGQWGHANSLYKQVLHVPLIVIYPSAVPQGARLSRQVSGRDIPATVLDLLGVPQDSAIGGVSLAALWRDSTARVSDVIAEVDQNMRPMRYLKNSEGPMKALLDDTLHVIRGAPHFEAYAYRADPNETHDLVAARGDTLPFASLLQQAAARHRLIWPRAVVRPLVDGTDADVGR
jgi:arylsulfatase A-like enzyme